MKKDVKVILKPYTEARLKENEKFKNAALDHLSDAALFVSGLIANAEMFSDASKEFESIMKRIYALKDELEKIE